MIIMNYECINLNKKLLKQLSKNIFPTYKSGCLLIRYKHSQYYITQVNQLTMPVDS